MATPPKTTAGSSPSDAGGAKPAAAVASPSADPQKVGFDLDPEVKKQLDAGGSYKPPEEKTKEYIPPGPHPMGDGVGGASGGVKLPDVPAEPAASPTAEKK